MGPMLWRDDYNLYWPGDPNSAVVPNYYSSEYTGAEKDKNRDSSDANSSEAGLDSPYGAGPRDGVKMGQKDTNEKNTDLIQPDADGVKKPDEEVQRARQDDLKAVDELPWAHPRRIWAALRMVLTYGITRDIIGHQSKGLEDIHARAPQFDNKVEHLWTTAQICSAIIMSIAHGGNDGESAFPSASYLSVGCMLT